MKMVIPQSIVQVRALVRRDEGTTLEFKRSTAELDKAMQTVCGFLNGSGGIVLIGVAPDKRIKGQDTSDKTLREIAQCRDKFDPPASYSVNRIPSADKLEVIAVTVDGDTHSVPYTFDGRAYERIGSTTRLMPKAKYDKMILDRAHSHRRWENEPAANYALDDIELAEVSRIIDKIQSEGQLAGPVGGRLSVLLDRLGLRSKGKILQAAVVVCGKTFLPDYPQCELRLARFRGIDKTEFIDQRVLRGPAFKLLEEAEQFCQRHLPVSGKVIPGNLQRVDKPLIPPDALREILVNALIHRDYSIAGGSVQLAVFDDRVEVWSTGAFLTGITPDVLIREHQSVLRNPIIADVFHRVGLIEKWGRGTNRVIAICRETGLAAPEFAEVAGSAVVRFRVPVGVTVTTEPKAHEVHVETQEAPSRHQVGTKSTLSRHQVGILELCRSEKALLDLMKAAGRTDRTKFRDGMIKPLVAAGFLELTVPDKPRSRMQRYRITEKGLAALKNMEQA